VDRTTLRQHLRKLVLPERTASILPSEGRREATIEAALVGTLGEALADLIFCLCSDDSADIRQSVRALAGLGPGLTPSGDDILVGLLAEAAVLEQSGLLTPSRVERLRAAVASAGKTTPVAAEMRRHALSGDFPEALVRFTECLGNPGDKSSRVLAQQERLVSQGATSGSDFLAGVVALASAAASQGEVQ
jgi:hypothetical protein